MRASFLRILQLFHENRSLCRLLLEEAVGVERKLRDQLEAHYASWREAIIGAIETLREAGLAGASCEDSLVAEMVVGMVERVARRMVLDEAVDLEPLADQLAAFFLRGILA